MAWLGLYYFFPDKEKINKTKRQFVVKCKIHHSVPFPQKRFGVKLEGFRNMFYCSGKKA